MDAKFDIEASELMKENQMKSGEQLEKLKTLAENKHEMVIRRKVLYDELHNEVNILYVHVCAE